MRELDDLLPTLQPPAGGLAGLQRRIASLEKPGRASRVNRWAWAVTACASLGVAAILVQPWITRQQRARALAAAMHAAMVRNQPISGIRVTDGAAIELPSGQANVRLYLVQTAPRTAGGK